MMKRLLVGKLRCVGCGHNSLGVQIATENELGIAEGVLICPLCSSRYPIRNGVPFLHPRPLTQCFQHAVSSSSWAERQLGETHSAEDAKLAEWLHYEYNISPRPGERQNLSFGLGWSWGPARSHTDMYNYHLNRLFRNAGISLQGKQVINVGCGAGREAEYLCVKHGAIVTGLDIAAGSVRAALDRSVSFDYWGRFDGVAGDMECLPLRDKSFDIGVVSTALHHAPNWRIPIKEMFRVARDAVLVDEAADAAVTRLAISLGFSSNREEDQSGNRVTRFKESTLAPFLVQLGAREHELTRYWLNTSSRFRWLTVGPLRIRPLMRVFESEALLRIQSALLDRVGNRIVAFAKL